MDISIRKMLSQTQGETILRGARKVYLIAAIASLATIVVGLVVAVFFQIGTWQSANEIPVPRAYVSSPLTLSADSVGNFLTPPHNIRFVPSVSLIHAPLKGRNILGHFTADTPNRLAAYPASFNILGGRDAALFERVRSVGKQFGLGPTKALINKVNALLPTLRKPKSIIYELQVIARDRFGNISKPEIVSFRLTYGPATAKPKISNSLSTRVESAERLTELQRLAKNIAFLVDPKETPVYFHAYRLAQEIPRKCGVSTHRAIFVSNFRRLFDQLRPKLRAANIEEFYNGVCSEWHRVLSEKQAAQEQASEARASVIAQNQGLKAKAEVERVLASVGRSMALTVVGAAFSAFLVISLLLALLMIENHTRSVRRVVEMLAENSSNQRPIGKEDGASK